MGCFGVVFSLFFGAIISMFLYQAYLNYKLLHASDAPIKDAADKYAEEIGMQDAKTSCVDFDTDGDGYVSCSIATKRPDGTIQITPIECANPFGFRNGCRIPKIQAIQKGIQ